MTNSNDPNASANGAPSGGTGSNSANGGPVPSGAHPAANSGDFFDWVRSLGIVRDNGWLGGVCAGISARIGLDPLIIRGVALVIAVLGGPIFIIYAVAWALLPDREGRILLQQLFRGVFEPAMIAVFVLIGLTFMPFMRGMWWQGPPAFWGMPDWLETTLRIGWIIALVVAAIALIGWIASRPRTQHPAPPHAPHPTPWASAAPPADGSAWSNDTSFTGAASNASFAAGGAQASTGGSAQHPTWQSNANERARAFGEKADAWGRDTAERANRAAERVTHSANAAAERATERANAAAAKWREQHLSAAFVSIVLGLALVVGAGAAAVVSGVLRGDGFWSHEALVVGIIAATAVLGVGIVVAGIRGRSSGALGFFSFAAIVAIVVTAILPSGTRFVPFGNADWNAAETIENRDASYGMLAGRSAIDLTDLTKADAGGTIDVWLGFGSAELSLPDNLPVRVETHALIGNAEFPRGEQARRVAGMFISNSRVVAADGDTTGPITTVRVWNLVGNIDVTTEATR